MSPKCFYYIKSHFIFAGLFIFSTVFCYSVNTNDIPGNPENEKTETGSSLKSASVKKIPELEQIMIEAGLVKISDFDPSIKIDLKYSTTNNFLKKNLYGNLTEGYLQEPVVRQLVKAQQYLKDTFPGYSLVVYDATRPWSIQKMMWDSMKISVDEKSKYISNPAYGSLHNYGAAVDVSIIDENGKELDMGTPYDSFEYLAYPVFEKDYLKAGRLTKKQIASRELLRTIMTKALFGGITTEWWHFNACSNHEARIFYCLLKNHTLKKKFSSKQKSGDHINISFKVQIKVSSRKIDMNSSDFKGLEVSCYHHNGLYKYVIGSLKDIASARELLRKVEKLGFNDAFIVAFNNSDRIEIRDAIELMQ
ncbi:MAG: M15 family metallopeptidase [Bacteroidia bacterium]|nr:M15 family metallopeptidase [Bacteroidia bacterium]